jgi:hypothetical protein
MFVSSETIVEEKLAPARRILQRSGVILTITTADRCVGPEALDRFAGRNAIIGRHERQRKMRERRP